MRLQQFNFIGEYMQFSLSELEQLTAVNYRTIRKRLNNVDPIKVDGRSHFYDSTIVLPLIYELDRLKNGDLDLNTEKAKLAAVQRQKIEIEIDEKQEKLVPADEVGKYWDKLVNNCRSKLLALPTRLAPQLVGIKDPNVIESNLRDVIYEALTELSNSD